MIRKVSIMLLILKKTPINPCRAGALVQWLKLPAWKVGDCGFEPHSGLQVAMKQNVSSLFTCKESIFLGAS